MPCPFFVLVIIPYVMKEVLLCNALNAFYALRKSVGVEIFHNTLYPYVNRESLCAIHSVKQSTFRNLRPYPLDGHQSLSGGVYVAFGDFFKGKLTAFQLLCSVNKILCPKACP